MQNEDDRVVNELAKHLCLSIAGMNTFHSQWTHTILNDLNRDSACIHDFQTVSGVC